MVDTIYLYGFQLFIDMFNSKAVIVTAVVINLTFLCSVFLYGYFHQERLHRVCLCKKLKEGLFLFQRWLMVKLIVVARIIW